MIDKFKQWFFTKSQREQVILSVGSIAAAFLLVYVLIWAPIVDHIANLRQSTANQQALLQWMTHAKDRLQSLQGGAMASRKPANNIMVSVEHSLAEDDLAKYLRSVKQPQSQQVEINLQAVPFDKFIGWMQTLLGEYELSVSRLNVTKGSRLGTVDVQFVMKAG